MNIIPGSIHTIPNATTFISQSHEESPLVSYTNVKYPWFGAIAMIIVGCVLTFSRVLIMFRFEELRILMGLDIVLVWAVIINSILLDRQRFFITLQLKALTHSLKILNRYRGIQPYE